MEEDTLSPSEKIAIRRVMEATIMNAGSFNFGELGASIVADLWPKLAEAVVDSEHFEDAESACGDLVTKALEKAAKKRVAYDDREYTRELMKIVLRVARETYCKLRDIPCEVKDTRDSEQEEEMGRLIHVDFGSRPSM